MRILVLLFVALTWTTDLEAQRVKLNKGKPESRTYWAEVSYRNVQGKIIIPVEIEGKTHQFLFDTGAPNLITSELSMKIRSKSLNQIKVRDANDNSREMRVLEIPKIGIGGVFFENTPTLVNDAESNFILDCFGVDGIIGSNMVRRSVVHLDSKNLLFSISNDPKNYERSIKGQEGIKMNLSESQSSPYIWIALQDRGKAREHVLFDTGMHGFYDMAIRNFEKLKALNAFGPGETGQGVKSVGLFNSTGANSHHRVTVPLISVGSWDFKNVTTVTMDADRSRIGSDLLTYGKVTLDFRNSKFYFQPYETERDLTEKSLGFSPTIKNGEIVVGIVWEDELSELLSYGDRILNVNGLDISAMDPCEFVNKPSPFKADSIFDIRFYDLETDREHTIRMSKK